MRVFVPFLVSIALATLGIWIFVVHLYGDILRWSDFRGATETDIHAVQSVNLYAKGSSGGKSFTVLEALWAYEVEGERFEGSSISIHRLRDNLDGFRQRLYDRLNSNSPGTCFYLNDSPEEAVLDRSLRPATIIISSLFCVIPLTLAAFFWRAALYERHQMRQ